MMVLTDKLEVDRIDAVLLVEELIEIYILLLLGVGVKLKKVIGID